MGLIKEEVYFPRGCSSSTKPALRKPKDALFKKHKKPKKKIKKTTIFNEDLDEENNEKLPKPHLSHAQESKYKIKPLTYQTLEEGMVVLGRVKEVLPFHMFINLPGRLSAKVPVTEISHPYTESLARLRLLEITQKECPPLSELFGVGQPIVCCVRHLSREAPGVAVTASLDPTFVNQARSHFSVKTGQVLVAAVGSEEDHGYSLHTGVSGLTAFLRHSNTQRFTELVNHGRRLVVGEIVRCLVTKCVTSDSATRVEVTIDPLALSRSLLSHVNTRTLQPATTVLCQVHEVLQTGLVVGAGKWRGLVERSQLGQCWAEPRDYQAGAEVKATVLYALPETDFQSQSRPTYLSLKNVTEFITPQFAIGEVLQASVVGASFKGVFLCLGEQKDNEKGNKGFVSIRRLGENISKEEVMQKYPKGKNVTTKILGFDYMEQIYNCSLEREKLEQPYVKVDQLQVGDRVSGQVTEVRADGLRLTLGPIRLFAFKDHSADDPYDNLHQHFTVGDTVDARVLKVSPESCLVTLKETLIRSPMLASLEEVRVGDCYWGTVRSLKNNYLLVTFYDSVAGSVRLPKSHRTFLPGQLVKCYVSYVNAAEERLLLSLKPPESQSQQPPELAVGEECQLVISRVSPEELEVTACDQQEVAGIIPRCHLPEGEEHQEGDFLKAWLYKKRGGKNYFSPNPAIQDFLKVQGSVPEPKTRLTCVVKNVTNKSNKVIVYTPLSVFPTGVISEQDCSKLKEEVKPHQIIKLYVAQVNLIKNSVVLSLKKPKSDTPCSSGPPAPLDSTNNKKFKNLFDFGGKSRNREMSSEIEKEENSSSFSAEDEEDEFDSESDSGKEEIDDHSLVSNSETEDLNNSTGNSEETSKKRKQRVDVEEQEVNESLVSKKKNSTKKLKLMSTELKQAASKEVETKKNKSKTKKKQVEGVSSKDESVASDTPILESKNKKEKDDGKSLGGERKSLKKRLSSESDDNELKHERKKAREDIKSTKKVAKDFKKGTLTETGFFWDVKPEDLNKPVDDSVEDNNEDVEEEEVEGKSKKKKSAAERRRAAKEEEARLREVEQSLMQAEADPQSADQFDRAVLARPDDDQLWIKYMSHHLQATEIEKARAVARRALQTINQRHEVERLNVWIALLNLEHLFGTTESLKETFDQAVQTNDEFTVYSKMLQIYSEAKKSQEAEKLVGAMLRKFRDSQSCWLNCLSALMSCELPDKARNHLQRATSVLPVREHVNLLCQFALVENQHGNSEQAQTLFEHVLTSYPKRVDVWSVYVDMLVKSGKLDTARQTLERATRQKLPARKMKSLFSKWVSFEEKHGSPEKVEHVRKQAIAYVNNITKNLE